MKILKICPSEWINESRDQRELSIYKELGMDVSVIAKGYPKDRGRIESVDGFKVYRYSTRPIKCIPASINRLISLFMWAHFIKKKKPDVISGHDLIGTTIGWLAFCGRKKPALIYDSHEFELGRNKKRGGISLWIIKHWEHFIINKSTMTIVVNKSIADELTRIHHLDTPPIIVRNIPDNWNIDEKEIRKKRKELNKNFENNSYLVLYHGALNPNRGLEQLIDSIAQISHDVKLIMIGNAETYAYRKRIEKRIADNHLKNRIMILPAVPHIELWKYIGAVDVCVAPIVPNFKSYYYSLPNKLFESIQCNTPIIGSDLPEISRIINDYNIGFTFNPYDPAMIATSINKMKQIGKQAFKSNLEKANQSLNWETEKKELINAFQSILKVSNDEK